MKPLIYAASGALLVAILSAAPHAAALDVAAGLMITEARSVSAVDKVVDRRCWRRNGVRHCRESNRAQDGQRFEPEWVRLFLWRSPCRILSGRVGGVVAGYGARRTHRQSPKLIPAGKQARHPWPRTRPPKSGHVLSDGPQRARLGCPQSNQRRRAMANKEQRGNREKRKPKKEKPKPAAQISSFSSASAKTAAGKKT